MNEANIEEQIQKIEKKAKSDDIIIGVSVFGSYLLGDNFKDVDIALAFKSNSDKQLIFSKRIEYASDFSDVFDFQALNSLPLTVQKQALEGRIIYETRELYDLAYFIIREYEDFEKYRVQYIEGVLLED
ncbi:MAG: hypothetical protein GPJ51_08610 [Candidatus Heimdallarchaeota archaeon]|nr:hypothetical protein [Candidatus Heimdallarchaeota archaeon]